MNNYIYSQTIIQFRQEVNEDGSLGKPQMLRSWVSPMKGYQGSYVKRVDKEVTTTKKAVQQKKLQLLQTKEEEQKKKEEQKKQNLSLLQTTIGEAKYQ